MVDEGFTSISVKVGAAREFTALREEMGYSTTETLRIMMAAYDIINGTGQGSRFSEAVKRAYAEVEGMVPA